MFLLVELKITVDFWLYVFVSSIMLLLDNIFKITSTLTGEEIVDFREL